MMTPESFLLDIQQYLSATGMSASAFGRAAVGDPSLVLDLRNGREPTLGLVRRVITFMQANPPAQPSQGTAA